MRKNLFGVLVVLAMLLTTVGAYVVTSGLSSTTQVQEPITVTQVATFSSTMYPGETNTYSFNVSNAATDVSYNIAIIPSITADSGVNAHISSVTVDGNPITADTNGYYNFTIAGGSTSTVDITIQTTTDSAPGNVTLTVTLDRS